MPITLLDGILVGFTLVSAVLAMVRGFSREVLSIASWIAAAAAAYFFYPNVLPYIRPYIDNEQLAMAAAAAAVFVVALIVVTLITMKIADFIIDSRVGALDRTLGFLYGAARGILVIAVALLFFNWLVGSNLPGWVAQAKSRPLLEDIGQRLQAMLPEDPERSILGRIDPDADQAAEPGADSAGSEAGRTTAEPNAAEAPADGAEAPAEGSEAPSDAEPPANN